MTRQRSCAASAREPLCVKAGQSGFRRLNHQPAGAGKGTHSLRKKAIAGAKHRFSRKDIFSEQSHRVSNAHGLARCLAGSASPDDRHKRRRGRARQVLTGTRSLMKFSGDFAAG
jgi:hypothetical protein